MGDLSQILQHTKGECRSGRCIIELSFDNQQTFEIFREHSSTVSTIKSYLQVHAVDLQPVLCSLQATRRDDDGLYYHTNPDGLGQVLDDDLDLLNTRILFSHREALSKVSKDALFLCPRNGHLASF